jgi:hypothetical protein
MDMNEIDTYIRASRSALDLFKSLRGLLPKGPDADAADEQLDRAEKALRASEAELAKALGYELCKCTFPPQIMLSQGRHPVHDKEIFECPKCGKQEPSPKWFEQLDRSIEQRDQQRRSWADHRRR